MIRCHRCNATVGVGLLACGPVDAASCNLRSALLARTRLATQLGTIDAGKLQWKAICWDFTNRLQLFAAAPALQKFADEDLSDAGAALRRLLTVLGEGPLGPSTRNAGRK